MSKIINLDDENFDYILDSPLLSVILFWTPWCGHCSGLISRFNKLSDEMTDINFIMINKDVGEKTAQKYEISSVPSLVFLKNGVLLENILGNVEEEKLIDLINNHK